MENFGRGAQKNGKLGLQKLIALFMVGAISLGILVDYSDFCKQVTIEEN